MPKNFKVALAIAQSGFMSRELFIGAHSYANTKPNWEILRVNETGILNWTDALSCKANGIIGILLRNEPIDPKALGKTRLVVVNSSVKDHPYHSVIPNAVEGGRLMAAHLLEKHLSHFGYVGLGKQYFTELKKHGFEKAIRKSGNDNPIPSFDLEPPGIPSTKLHAWLKALPLPCGIACATDTVSKIVIRTGLDCQIRIPHDLAIVSSSNDLIACVESPVTLSSLDEDFQQVGYRAAAKLDALMSNQETEKIELIPPGEMFERDSTRMNGVEDQLVRRAMKIIQEEFREEFNVDNLLKRLGAVSRRQLELRFRVTLNSTPHEEIMKSRIREAQRLLRCTRFSVKEIAYNVGFYDPSHFCRFFKLRTGQTPINFRKTHTRLG